MDKRISVYIYTNNPLPEAIREIAAGIEEEGVLYEVFQHTESSLDVLTYNASCESLLGCGIGVIGDKAKMQLSSLPKGNEISSVDNFDKLEYRRLGSNTARLVKKKALI